MRGQRAWGTRRTCGRRHTHTYTGACACVHAHTSQSPAHHRFTALIPHQTHRNFLHNNSRPVVERRGPAFGAVWCEAKQGRRGRGRGTQDKPNQTKPYMVLSYCPAVQLSSCTGTTSWAPLLSSCACNIYFFKEPQGILKAQEQQHVQTVESKRKSGQEKAWARTAIKGRPGSLPSRRARIATRGTARPSLTKAA